MRTHCYHCGHTYENHNPNCAICLCEEFGE